MLISIKKLYLEEHGLGLMDNFIIDTSSTFRSLLSLLWELYFI